MEAKKEKKYMSDIHLEDIPNSTKRDLPQWTR